jgi:hypothetical protein
MCVTAPARCQSATRPVKKSLCPAANSSTQRYILRFAPIPNVPGFALNLPNSFAGGRPLAKVPGAEKLSRHNFGNHLRSFTFVLSAASRKAGGGVMQGAVRSRPQTSGRSENQVILSSLPWASLVREALVMTVATGHIQKLFVCAPTDYCCQDGRRVTCKGTAIRSRNHFPVNRGADFSDASKIKSFLAFFFEAFSIEHAYDPAHKNRPTSRLTVLLI